MDLAAFFSALDTSLSLHYLTNTTDPAVHELCASATSLCKKRIDQRAAEAILGVDPAIWTVSYSALLDAYCIGPPASLTPKALSGALDSRRAAFQKRLAMEIESKPASLQELAAETRARDARAKSVSRDRDHDRDRDRDRRPQQGSRDRVAKARAQLSKVSRRLELKEVADSPRLSLLERIRLKEQARKADPPEAAYATRIRDKLPAIYDILYDLTRSDEEKTFLFSKVVSIIKDSTFHSISDNEASDALASISNFLPTKFSVLHSGEIKALKIRTLDRDKDLDVLARDRDKDLDV